ncbi:MAG: insulinase family protein [Candidatus Nomurabacteria bacterium]|nr:insulinase family protein [Candidatus Nomurabacteria bacterium]
MKKPKTTILKNGVTVVTVAMPGNPTVTTMALCNTGSHFETPETSGISHFLEHMVFKGTKNRNRRDIMHALDSMGSQTNAFTGEEYTGYYAKGAQKSWSKMLDIVSDIYLNPAFPEKDLETERGVILGEIDMYEDNFKVKAVIEFENLLYGDQPAGMPILGPKENIKKFTRDTFLGYRKQHYVADATTMIVAGDINHRDVVKQAQDLFADISTSRKTKKQKIKTSQKKPAVRVHYKKTDQAHMILGVHGFSYGDKDLVVGNVLATVLGQGMSSRLFEKIREELGLGYYVKASQDAFVDAGSFAVLSGVDPKRIDTAITAILDEIRRFVDESVGDKELNKAKQYLMGNLMMQLESSDSVAEWFGLRSVLKQDLVTPAEYTKQIRAVTSADIKRVAKKLFVDKHLNLSIVGPYKDDKRFKNILKF